MCESELGSLLARAAELVALLVPHAVRDPDRLSGEIARLTGPQVRAALLVVALFDRDRQAGPVRFDIDMPALDALAEAGEPADVWRAVLALDEDDARQVLAELLLLHRDLEFYRQLAGRSAALN